MKRRPLPWFALLRVLCCATVLVSSVNTFGAGAGEETSPSATAVAPPATGDPAVAPPLVNAANTGETGTHSESIWSHLLAKHPRTGGVDPHGDSWESIRNSLEQFASPLFVLRLFLSLTLAVACAWVIAWHPRRSTRVDPISDLEERKTFVILGVVGAVVAELSGTSSVLAFVIFGIGALLRFRTVLDNPKATGKAILVVVIGLACGMGSWTMAVFVTAFSWTLLYWLDSMVSFQIRIRLDGEGDPQPVHATVQSLLAANRCRVQGHSLSKSKKRLEFTFQMPAGLDPQKLESELKAKFPKLDPSRISVQML